MTRRWRGRLLKALKPGGRLLISDYCRAEGQPSPGFAEYIAQRSYDLHSVAAYGEMLSRAGFTDVVAEDRTWQVRRFRSPSPPDQLFSPSFFVIFLSASLSTLPSPLSPSRTRTPKLKRAC